MRFSGSSLLVARTDGCGERILLAACGSKFQSARAIGMDMNKRNGRCQETEHGMVNYQKGGS